MTMPDAPCEGPGEANNLLLRQLAGPDRASLAALWRRRSMKVGEVIARAGETIDTIVFPLGGVVAILDTVESDRRLAVGLIGREGFAGWPMLLGEHRWPHDVILRAEAADALCLPAARLEAACAQSSTLRAALLSFAHVFTVQMARTIVSALAHPVDRRMARWLLLYHDRVAGDAINVTHEEFRLMLGVRRSSITDALHRLEADHAVRSLRGRVVIRDRERLIALAGDCYGEPERVYRRLIGSLDDVRREVEPA